MIKFLLMLTLSFSLNACKHLQSVSITPIPKNRTQEVSAKSSRFIFLGFNFNNDYVDEVVSKLKRKCNGGVIKGILTKDESITYFPLFAHSREVTATGYCVKSSRKRRRS